MGLVDYSSDSSESDGETTGPQTKRRKTSEDSITTSPSTANELPPLPAAFHDLYASTVRVSASDDSTLHQGRKRVNPHKVGNWPSHLYIEWHPTPSERETLTTLLSNLQSRLTSPSSLPLISPSTDPITITSFLTSDLGAPQPLHISLSRPIVLSTSQKDPFLSDLESRVRSSGIPPFELAPTGLEWHRTAESARSFLILRVSSTGARKQKTSAHVGGEAKTIRTGAETGVSQASESESETGGSQRERAVAVATNPQLAALLRRANALVTAYGQPALYAFAKSSDDNTTNNTSSKNEDDTGDSTVDTAFHVSVAWSFASPDASLRRLTEEAFNSAYEHKHKHSPATETGAETETKTGTIKDAISTMRIRVDGIKAKIGNVVTDVPLPLPGSKGRGREGGRGLFGF